MFIKMLFYAFFFLPFSLKAAVEGIQKHGMSLREAAKTFGVPRSTIGGYLKKRKRSMEVGITGHSLLTSEEENKLLQHIHARGVYTDTKYGSKTELLKVIHEFLCTVKEDPNYPMPSKSYVTRFCLRHPDLAKAETSTDLIKKCSGEVLAMSAATMAKGFIQSKGSTSRVSSGSEFMSKHASAHGIARTETMTDDELLSDFVFFSRLPIFF